MADEGSETEKIEIIPALKILEFSQPEMQQARSFLRERFLRFMLGIIGKKAEFNLYENSHVSGEFYGCDVECLDLYVKNLETPLGIVPKAILRSTDVISFVINNLESPE